MKKDRKFEIDIDILLNNGLSLEAYLILYCIKTNDVDFISSYTRKCKKINTQVFNELEQKGFISIKRGDTDQIFFENLSLATSGQSLLETVIPSLKDNVKLSKEELEKQFGELRKCYPMSVKAEGGVPRRLQGNLNVCKQLYEKLLMETSHEILCKAAKLYTEEKYRSRSERFIQNFETWLRQKNYQQYLEDIEKNINFTGENISFTDDI